MSRPDRPITEANSANLPFETIKRHLPARQAEMRALGEYLESQFWLEDITGFAEQVRGFKK